MRPREVTAASSLVANDALGLPVSSQSPSLLVRCSPAAQPHALPSQGIGDHLVRRRSSQAARAALHAVVIFSAVGANVACPLPCSMYAHSNSRSLICNYWANLSIVCKSMSTSGVGGSPPARDCLDTRCCLRNTGLPDGRWSNLHYTSLPVPTGARQTSKAKSGQHDPANRAAW